MHEQGVAIGIVGSVRGHIEDIFSPQLLPAELPPLCQRVPGIHGHYQTGLFHRPIGDVLLCFQIGTVPCENDVVLLVHQTGSQRVGGAAVKGDEHIAVLLVKAAHQHRQVAALVSPHIAHPQGAGEAGRGVVYPFRRPAHPFQNGAGVQQKRFPRRGQADGPGAAVEQSAAQRFLQQTDLLGHGGLRDVVLLGGFGEAAGLCRRHKVFQLISVHRGAPPR